MNTLAPSKDTLMHQYDIQPGDEITIHKHDGTTVSLIVRNITHVAVIGTYQRVLFADIDTVAKTHKSSMTTAGTVLIIVLIVLGGLASAYASHALTSHLFGL